jgi:predicted nucleotidyltransferase component of viral defense system
MTRKAIRNIAASVWTRLTAIAREKGEDFQRILIRYATERFLYRLERSGYGDSFVLKGAMLFVAQGGWPYRPTRDLDLLGRGDAISDNLADIVRRICTVAVEDDGVRFDPASVQVQAIREDQEHGGLRVRVTVSLEQVRIHLQIDVGFGDSVVPPPQLIDFPSLLGFPTARIRAYSKETVIAEKAQALIVLGNVNSRMKDYYDFWSMSLALTFDGSTLTDAMKASFATRGTKVPPSLPEGLSDEFTIEHETMWKGFLRRIELHGSAPDLHNVVNKVRSFLLPPLEAVRDGKPFDLCWLPRGPWEKRHAERDEKKQ